MNLNDFPMQNERKRGHGWRNNVVPIQINTNLNSPKRTKTKSSTTPSSHSLKWKANQNSVIKTGSSSRTCTTTSSNDSRVILALSEGRGEAACEVGIASIDLLQPKLILCQISDTQSYTNTMTKINILNPKEIVVPLTFVGTHKTNRLVEKVKEYFPQVKITPIVRSVFNKTNGMTTVKNLCIPNMNSVLLILQNRYYALAAASGLLSYIENVLNVIYSTYSLKIQYQESEGSTIIDITTADKLELVACANQPLQKQYSSLYSIMNYCLTKIGARTLRASILQPPSLKNEIESRLECVSELIERSGTGATYVLRSLLAKIPNIDQLLNVVTLIPKQPQDCSERQLNYLLLLNSFFEILEPLRECLREFENPYFKQVVDNLARNEFDCIKSLMKTVIVEDARPAKGASGALQRCFAIKPGINSLLDLVRKSYSERLDEMRVYVKNLGEKYNLPLTLSNNNIKGYHIVLPLKKNEKKTFKRSMLPNEFIQIDRLSSSFTMKTTDLINFSVRVEEIMMNILKISNIIIHKTLLKIKEYVALFYKLCEDVSKLDMLQSLAKLSGDTNYVRPKFSDYMDIKHGRHPILDFICPETPISNSIIATDDHNVHIISGPNGSGKSIFIRQLVLIQVMAQVGCYVPAESATLRIADRILARISLDDNPDIGVSAFVLEILEVEYFLEAMSKNTLIVVDELCRSTSVEEGTALAMAICEKLAETPAFVFFTTHFKPMALLGDVYMNIKIWQMQTGMEEKNGKVFLNFIYRLLEGMITLENYGVYVAKSCWPNAPIDYALNVLKNNKQEQTDLPESYKQNYLYFHLKYDLEADLRFLKKNSKLFPNILNKKLETYQNSFEQYGESIRIHVDDLTTQNRTVKPIEKSKECDPSDTNNKHQKSSSSSGYIIQNNSKTSFGNSSLSQNDSVDYGDITFSGRPISSSSQNGYNEEDIDIRNVTFNWKPSQDEAGNNCYDYLGLYQKNPFQIDNNFVPVNNDNFLVHRDQGTLSFNSICSSDQTKNYSDRQEFNESDNSKIQFKIPLSTRKIKTESKNDKSFLSVNEEQFTLLLAENRNKTSTPLPKINTLDINYDVSLNYKCSEKDFIESELESNSEYFSDTNWEEIFKNRPKHKNIEPKSSSITLNINDSQKLNPQEIESVITDLESVSEYFSDNEWNEEGENINKTSNDSKELQSDECLGLSISYSPDESILKEIENKSRYSGESVFKIEAKRRKIKVPFHAPKPFVRKIKRHRRNPKGNNYKNSTDEKLSEPNQEKNTVVEQEIQTLEKSSSPKKIIVHQNIILKPATKLGDQTEILFNTEQKNQTNFDNNEETQQQKESPHENKSQAKIPVMEIETDSHLETDKVSIEENQMRKKKMIMEKNELSSSEDFLKTEENTTKRCKLGIKQKRSNKLLNTDKRSNLNVEQNKVPNTTSSKNSEKPPEDVKNHNSSSQEFYYSANESLHEVQKTSTSATEENQSLSSTARKRPTPSRKLNRSKFISPLRLTKKEIKEDFEKQDRLMLEENSTEKYIQNILNRPSIQSIQQSECVAVIYRTSEGTKVVTPSPRPKRKRKIKPFLPPLLDKPVYTFDVSLFSDRNADKFEKMMGFDRQDDNLLLDRSPYELKVKKSKEIKETTLCWDFPEQQTSDEKKLFTKTDLSKYLEEKEESFSECDNFLSFNGDNENQSKSPKGSDNGAFDIDSIMAKYLNN